MEMHYQVINVYNIIIPQRNYMEYGIISVYTTEKIDVCTY